MRAWRYAVRLGATLLLAGVSTQAAAAGRSGTYATTPPVSYSCGLGVFTAGFTSLTVADAEPSITVSTPGHAEPGVLIGTITDPTFSTQKFEPGGCAITQTIAGSFTSSTTLQATYNIAFSGSGCASSGCSNQSFAVTGTRPPPVPIMPPAGLALLGVALFAVAVSRHSPRA